MANKKVYTEEKISAIAEKIREKTKTEETYTVTEMPAGIDEVYEAGYEQGQTDIPSLDATNFIPTFTADGPMIKATVAIPEEGKVSGGEISSVALATDLEANLKAENIIENKTIFGITGTGKIGIDTSDATATAADILSTKTAYTQKGLTTGTMPIINNGSTVEIKTTTATIPHMISASLQIPQSGYMSNESQLPLGFASVQELEPNFKAENIIKGVTMFGIEGVAPTDGVDTSDATATAEQILTGYTAYTSEGKIKGVMPILTNSDFECSIQPLPEVTGVGSLMATPLFSRLGYIDNISPFGVQLISLNSIEPNFLPENIKKGVSMLGVKGTANNKLNEMLAGTLTELTPADLEGLVEIRPYAFYNLGAPSSLEMPDSIIRIGENAFGSTMYFSNLVLSNGLKILEAGAFHGMLMMLSPNIFTIEGNKYYLGSSENPYLVLYKDITTSDEYIHENTKILFDGACYLKPINGELVIREGITSLGSNLISPEDINTITKLIFPTSVEYVSTKFVQGKLESMTECVIPGGFLSTEFCPNVTDLTITKGSVQWTFTSGNDILKSLTTYDKVVGIASGGFSGFTSLSQVSLAEGLETIGSGAFAGCTSLINIIIPSTVREIGGYALQECQTITMRGSTPPVISDNTFRNVQAIQVPRGSLETYKNATNWSVYADLMSEYNSPSVGLEYTENGDGTCTVSGMGRCQDTEIIIPQTAPSRSRVTHIGSSSFISQTSLTTVTIPEGVVSIGAGAFDLCSALATVFMPKSMTDIQQGAFWGCNSLRNVYYAGTEEEWNTINIDSKGNQALQSATIYYDFYLPQT